MQGEVKLRGNSFDILTAGAIQVNNFYKNIIFPQCHKNKIFFQVFNAKKFYFNQNHVRMHDLGIAATNVPEIWANENVVGLSFNMPLLSATYQVRGILAN